MREFGTKVGVSAQNVVLMEQQSDDDDDDWCFTATFVHTVG